MSDEIEAKLAALAAQVGALQAEVTELRAGLAEAAGRVGFSLRGQQRCPACGARDVLYARQVLDRGESNTRTAMAIVQPSFWSSKVRGKFELYACRACGLCEWYAPDADTVEGDGKDYVIMSGKVPDVGPYR